MSGSYNIFISWSGNRSRWVADSLRNWLPLVIQAAQPWMSDTDIGKGARGLDEVARVLSAIQVGICCLTPENLKAPWILYEAGALSKTIGNEARLCTYLAAGLQYHDIEPPLGMFQATKAEKNDTRRMMSAINTAIGERPVPEPHLDAIFEALWPRLEEKLKSLPKAEAAAPESVEEPMDGLDYGKASTGLLYYCVAAKADVPVEEQERLALSLKELGGKPIGDAIKVRILRVYLQKAFGADVVYSALKELRVHLRPEK